MCLPNVLAPRSIPEILGNLFQFTAAGFDTTANTMAYAIKILAIETKWQDWIIEEIDSVLNDELNPSLYKYIS